MHYNNRNSSAENHGHTTTPVNPSIDRLKPSRHGKATPCVTKLVEERYLETLKCGILSHLPPNSPNVASSADFQRTHVAQWHTTWLISTSPRMKKQKIGSTHGSYRRITIFCHEIRLLSERWVKVVVNDG
nr:Mariner Mos1 transposase [Hymenolepis microstoma]